MARPKNPFPVPALRIRGRSWQIRWRDGERRYAATIGPLSPEVAKALCALAAAALTGLGAWPPELESHPEVRRFQREREGVADDTDLSLETLAARYVAHLRAHANSHTAENADWAANVRGYLARWIAFVGDMDAATPKNTAAWLMSLTRRVAKKGKGNKGKFAATATPAGAATRNRARAAVSGFARWMRESNFAHAGFYPTQGVRSAPEVHGQDTINVWDAPAIPALLAAADTRPDGVAVWLGVYAGLRRGEIARLSWADIGPSYITVRTSKTGRARNIPLSDALHARLAREPRLNARVVGLWPVSFHAWAAIAKKWVEEYLPKAFPWPGPGKPPPLQYGWNTLRHTFASRHVQAGVPIETVAAWIGDRIDTCLRHYARFVPRDHRDERIDAADKTAAARRAKQEEEAKKQAEDAAKAEGGGDAGHAE